jgi:hypothetical protein
MEIGTAVECSTLDRMPLQMARGRMLNGYASGRESVSDRSRQTNHTIGSVGIEGGFCTRICDGLGIRYSSTNLIL